MTQRARVRRACTASAKGISSASIADRRPRSPRIRFSPLRLHGGNFRRTGMGKVSSRRNALKPWKLGEETNATHSMISTMRRRVVRSLMKARRPHSAPSSRIIRSSRWNGEAHRSSRAFSCDCALDGSAPGLFGDELDAKTPFGIPAHRTDGGNVGSKAFLATS